MLPQSGYKNSMSIINDIGEVGPGKLFLLFKKDFLTNHSLNGFGSY